MQGAMLVIQFRVLGKGRQPIFECKGQAALAMLALIDAGDRGCTVSPNQGGLALLYEEMATLFALSVQIETDSESGTTRYVLQNGIEILFAESVSS